MSRCQDSPDWFRKALDVGDGDGGRWFGRRFQLSRVIGEAVDAALQISQFRCLRAATTQLQSVGIQLC